VAPRRGADRHLVARSHYQGRRNRSSRLVPLVARRALASFAAVAALSIPATAFATGHARLLAAPAVELAQTGTPAPVAAPLTPPADWVVADTRNLAVSNLRVFAAWRMRLDHNDVFTPNINVGVEKFDGDLDAYDRASIAGIHGTSPTARILLHEKTTICNGIPAWHTIWTADSLANLKLHFEQIYTGADQAKFVATYTRALTQPDVEEARIALRTMCNPVPPLTN
jgi:hypothetical protein